MHINGTINKENMDSIFKDLGKRFRKLNGRKTPAEIILVGGAAIIASYGFRDSTNDIDALISASSALKDAAAKTGDAFGLENNWLNSEFQKTTSFSSELVKHSKYYRTFSNILQVRVVQGEYLLATKLVAGRDYKNDLSDIIGIIVEQKKLGEPITFEKVDKALNDLYGGWNRVNAHMREFFEAALKNKDLALLMEQVRELEELHGEEIVDNPMDIEPQPKFRNEIPFREQKSKPVGNIELVEEFDKEK